MPRPAGRANDDHQAKRDALLERLAPSLLSVGPERPSLRELAEAAGVQPNTLRHYFGGRAGLVSAVLARAGDQGRPYLAAVDQMVAVPLEESLPALLSWVVAGWTDDALGGLHAAALAEGMGVAEVGPVYVTHVLEPTLQAFERLISAHVDQGHLPDIDVRVATLALVSPVLLALLHQRQLGGGACRPLDLQRFVAEHTAAWLRGWAAPP